MRNTIRPNQDRVGRSSHAAKAASFSDHLPDLSQQDFERIASRVKKITGIVLEDHKKVLVRSRIMRRLRELKMTSFSAYLDYLEGRDGENEMIAFCNAITTNLTSFFRERHHFDHLAAELTENPDLKKAPRIWSAGCSNGQEPYSIAMTMAAVGVVPEQSKRSISATDIDTNMLETGRRGIYPIAKFETLPKEYQRHATRTPDGISIEMKPQLREMIEFSRLNFFTPWPRMGPFDFIFCRNVMIYFDQDAKEELVDKFSRHLKMGGVLYLGHSENLMKPRRDLEAAGRTTYRKIA